MFQRLVLVTIGFLLVGCTAVSRDANNPAALSPLSPLVVAPSLAADNTDIENWGSFSDEEFGLRFNHPPMWEAHGTELSRLFAEPSAQMGAPTLPRFWISRVPDRIDGCDTDSCALVFVYNYVRPGDVDSLERLPVGGDYAIGMPAEYWTYTRLPSLQVADRPALVVENTLVWHGDDETKDRRLFLRDGTDLLVFGAYYETAEELAQLNAILSSVELVKAEP